MSTATTHIKIEKQLIPALRFEEFEGHFKLKEFDEITDITRLAGYEYSKYWKEDEEQEIIALRGYNIGKGELNLRDLGYISNELSLQLKRSRLSVGDIVYPCVGSIGNAVVIEENDKFHIQQNIAKITCNDFASPYYLVQFLTSDYGLKEVYRFNASGAQPNVLVGSLRKYRINIPALPEQQKIASFLSAVDEKIQQLTKKKELLGQYKKGVMQQLFSGQLRFKDENGNPYPDWEEKRLINITKINQGLQIAISERYLEPVEDGYFYITNEFLRAKSEKAYYIKSPPTSVICDEDDILMTRTGNTGQVVTGVKGAFHNNFFKIKYQDHCDKWFLYYFLTSPITQHTILKLAGTSTIPDLNHGDFYKIKIDLPSIKEQSKISSVVKSIDTKIEAVNNQLTQTQTFKKGLLQQMFVTV